MKLRDLAKKLDPFLLEKSNLKLSKIAYKFK